MTSAKTCMNSELQLCVVFLLLPDLGYGFPSSGDI